MSIVRIPVGPLRGVTLETSGPRVAFRVRRLLRVLGGRTGRRGGPVRDEG